jgi:hypothetical protein
MASKGTRKPKPKFTSKKSVTENHVKKAVKERLNEIGAYHFWPVQMGLGEACLDCIGCYNGLFFGIETKRPGKMPTQRQLFTAERMRAAGGMVFVVDSEKAAKELFMGD